jgi:TonB family protein
MKSLFPLIAVCFFVSVSLAQTSKGPILESAQMPKYPAIAVTAHISGDVDAEFTLDNSGNVISVQILSGSPFLARATEENIKTWKFKMPPENIGDSRKFQTTFTYHLSGRHVEWTGSLRLTVTFDSFKQVEITSDQPKPITN